MCLKTDLISYGGSGYAHILNNLIPIMLKKGIKRGSINTIMIGNPKELLDIWIIITVVIISIYLYFFFISNII